MAFGFSIFRSRALFVAAALLAMAGSAGAGTLLYTPTNPSFGGNPSNGPNLLAVAQAQNQFTQSKSTAGTTASAALTPGQIFAQQLTSQLYSSLANKITEAIFGANAAPSGTFSFEGTTITYQTVGGNIEISINDGSTITNVTVPAGP
ncbi:curli assembly protein CsgF [Methylocapsa sp. S129]|uniref:curli assembly protein CsgF n=1 Tax=Methylocapsa sp. S129 TaxID=1641869 RepID=UPI00131D6105|nr:curli assembly protein CsgF [Methylocapsa sp. S129]